MPIATSGQSTLAKATLNPLGKADSHLTQCFLGSWSLLCKQDVDLFSRVCTANRQTGRRLGLLISIVRMQQHYAGEVDMLCCKLLQYVVCQILQKLANVCRNYTQACSEWTFFVTPCIFVRHSYLLLNLELKRLGRCRWYMAYVSSLRSTGVPEKKFPPLPSVLLSNG